MNVVSFQQALRSGLKQALSEDQRVVLLGVGITDHVGVFGTTKGLLEQFGSERVVETPIVENATTGFALGLAAKGYRPVISHIRVDFLMLCMDQIVNHIASYSFGNGGNGRAGITIRAIVGRGWGQGYQHSKSLHSMFAHIPGLEVYAPATVEGAYRSIVAAIKSPNPSIILEHRWLYFQEGEIDFTSRVGVETSTRLCRGNDAVIVATSWMAVEAAQASRHLAKHGINVEVFSHNVLHRKIGEDVLSSIRLTGVAVVADNDWSYSGFGAELASQIYEECFHELTTPIGRIGFHHSHIPTAEHLEREFYPDANDIIEILEKLLGITLPRIDTSELHSHAQRFKGPF